MEYETTHPWISFKIDLVRAPARLWLSLGEAKSKCEHLAGVPLQPDVAEEMHIIYLARGALATTAIEGNTLTEEEAVDVVKGKSKLPKSQQYLAREIKNIQTAISLILGEIERSGPNDITVEDIKKYNTLVLDRLEVEDYVTPGEFAKCQVGVFGYVGAPWQESSQLVSDLCTWLNGKTFEVIGDDQITSGIIKAIVAHIYIAWIHPFGDGNGRTSRLLEYRILIEAGIPAPAAHLLSNHYNKTRSEYYRRLDETSKNGGDLTPFIQYAVNGFVDLLRSQLKYVKAQQWEISWINYVHEVLGAKKNASTHRQLELVLALSEEGAGVAKPKLVDLSPEIARLYAGKTDKTITRDINKLIKIGLVEKTGRSIRAKKEKILSFLPRGRKGAVENQIAKGAELREEANQFDIHNAKRLK